MKRSETILMVLQVPLDYVLILAAGISAYHIRFVPFFVSLREVRFDLTLVEYLSVVSLASIVLIILFARAGLYTPDPNKKLAEILKKITTTTTLALGLVAVFIMFSQYLFESRFLIGMTWILVIIYLSIGRLVMRGIKGILYRMGVGLRDVVIIGDKVVGSRMGAELERRRELGYRVGGVYDSFEPKYLRTAAGQSVDEVLFAHPRGREDEALRVIEYCNMHHIVFKYSADLFQSYAANATVSALAGMPVIELRRTPLEGWGKVVKRVTDIVVSVVCIVITSPIMIMALCAILIETGRPAIYRNERVGYRGHRFVVYKFRSMFQRDSTGEQFGVQGKNAEQRERTLIKKQNARKGPIYKIQNDPRVTPVGRFLRRWSIDELPQFFNVLAGQMSIVGPRPHQPREVSAYADEYPTIFAVKPGITGLSQISGRSDLDFEEEMRLDILYIERWTWLLDWIIIVKTPFILFKRRKVE